MLRISCSDTHVACVNLMTGVIPVIPYEGERNFSRTTAGGIRLHTIITRFWVGAGETVLSEKFNGKLKRTFDWRCLRVVLSSFVAFVALIPGQLFGIRLCSERTHGASNRNGVEFYRCRFGKDKEKKSSERRLVLDNVYNPLSSLAGIFVDNACSFKTLCMCV